MRPRRPLLLLSSLAFCSATLSTGPGPVAAEAGAPVATPKAIELSLFPRKTGQYAASASTCELFPYLSPGGRFSLAGVGARVAELEPAAGARQGAFLLMHGRDDGVHEVRRLEVAGEGLSLSASVGLPDGGALVAGSPDPYAERTVVARLSPEGSVSWALVMDPRPDPGCNASQELCRFSTVENLVVEGERAFAVVNFVRGVLRLGESRSVEGKGKFNNVLVTLDVRTGAVERITSTLGHADPGMVLRPDQLVMVKSGDPEKAPKLLVLDPRGARAGKTLDVATRPGTPLALAGHGDGFALLLLKGAEAPLSDVLVGSQDRCTLVGLDSRGKVRFTRDVPQGSRVAAAGPLLYVATPAAIELRTSLLDTSSGGLVANGVVVRQLDASGRELQATTHPGYFDLSSLRLRASAGVWLTGVLLDAGSARLVAQPVGAPVNRTVTAPGRSVQARPGPSEPGTVF